MQKIHMIISIIVIIIGVDIFGIAAATPNASNNVINVIQHAAEINSNAFKYVYELDNNVKAEQQGSLKDDDIWTVNGRYAFISPEGESISIQYTADENGYRVDAANPLLPTSPPVPDAIKEALKYIAARRIALQASDHVAS